MVSAIQPPQQFPCFSCRDLTTKPITTYSHIAGKVSVCSNECLKSFLVHHLQLKKESDKKSKDMK